MPWQDDRVRLRHMVDHAREAVTLLGSRALAQLEADRVLCLALVHLVEIVGEAATRISVGTQSACPHIPWPQITSMRNRLVHGYDSVDLEILWQTVREDLPGLITELEDCLQREEC